ncbi:alpha-amylase family glycosyl hydrolase [Granulicella cerasi]|uniref:Alpha-amylase family glycosyl hydrolase n=2 Tax=Granulicella cerasi TaxID=741063 RepID=A0ABW1ZA10_9BACT
MPNVVMMAKSTYVWLEQLSKKYGRHIHRLDQVPDEEIALLADRGITALWLIGLWERSTASRTIKHLRGHGDAVASAYSLKDYSIAADLGGYEAYEHLKRAAARHGLRLASDMVPNHMGIDSSWVIENPEAFLYRWESPYPSYSFNGPDLSTDSRVEIKLEDHYYDQSDAAVVFRLRHYADNTTRYMYHGNDGTTFAWNDTAQLDYTKAWVREQVMQTILHVARMFPIIRFDAAMVLAKRHVQRLWFPLPGAGGSIPSRAESAISQEEFDALMPHEFWREVVDRVAVEVPGTLLLAEAFWMLEGYFVRTLGMHRVYNSAFMNMLRDEENAKYRSYLKKTIEFDPDILKRYVNFMSNPDERTAIDQFGSGDKAFGVAVLMSTLPGLPMFGHGQIEGYTERYGMEFKQAKMDERPNDYLVQRHQTEIAPLLKKRYIFAESADFVLYDFWTQHGTVDENVFAYSNNFQGERSLIFYNNSYNSTYGTIHHSAASMDKGSGQLRQRSLADGLSLPWDDGLFFAYRDRTTNLEFIRRANDFHHNGLTLPLRGYQYAVLLDWRELRASAEHPWNELCDSLNGAGVYSLEEALRKLRLRPLHDALRGLLQQGPIAELVAKSAQLCAAEGTATAKVEAQDEVLKNYAARVAELVVLAKSFLPASTSKTLPTAKAIEQQLEALLQLPKWERGFSTLWPSAVRQVLPTDDSGPLQWLPALAWLIVKQLATVGVAVEAFDALALREVIAETAAAVGLEGERAWQAAAIVRAQLVWTLESVTKPAFWQDGDVRWLIGVNEHEGKQYGNKERFEQLLCALTLPELSAATAKPEALEKLVVKLCRAMESAGYEIGAFLQPVTPKRELAEVDNASTEVAVVPEAATAEPKVKAKVATKPPAKKPKK